MNVVENYISSILYFRHKHTIITFGEERQGVSTANISNIELNKYQSTHNFHPGHFNKNNFEVCIL